ncbi:MAG: AAA family ATPase [Solirubrobacteraceae bacterium]
MRYTSFRFRNFKGIADMQIELTGDVTTLIGLNESGKTTILEAIFCFSYGAEDLEVINPGMASLRVPEQWIPISRRANFNDTIEISAQLDLSDSDREGLRRHLAESFGLSLDTAPKAITIRELYKFVNSRHTDTERKWALTISGTKGRQRNGRSYRADSAEWQGAVSHLKTGLPRIWYFPNFLFELPERFALSSGALDSEEADDKSRFYRATFEQVLAELGIGANLQTHVVERLHSPDRADQRSLNSLLLDMGRVITTTIVDGWARIFGRPPAAQEVELAAEAEGDGGALELKIKGPDGYYDLSERSLGFRWFFMFLLMTSFHGREAGGSRSLFLLDEPASNLHSSAQAELLKSFSNLVDRCYLIYTTHSHHLIDVRWLDSAYVVKNAALDSLDFGDYMTTRVGANTAVSATRYRRFVADHPDQTSYFQPVLDLLDYRPSLLEPIPSVVLVEGKSDFYLLRYAIDVLGVPSDVHLVPGTGAGSLAPLIQLHIGWGKSFVVLLDGDKEGRLQQKRYEQSFGSILSGCCVLLSDLCGEVLEAEDLLTAADKQTATQAVFAERDELPRPKKALSQAIVELYARREAITLDPSSTARIEQLLSMLAQALAGHADA